MITYGVLKIKLSTPILYPTTHPWYGITLDGLLGWIWAKDRGLNKTPAENQPHLIQFPELPILQLEPKLYAASTMFLPAKNDLGANLIGCTNEIINKMANWDKPMIAQIRRGMKSFIPNKASGDLRASLERYWALMTPHVSFHFATEDYEALQAYLKRIKTECFGIGAKTRAGYGAIADTEWHEVSKDNSYCYQKEGMPTRPIPADGKFKGKFPKSTIDVVAWHPPYFSPFDRKECYQPPASQYLPELPTANTQLDDLLQSAATEQRKIAESIQKKKEKVKKDVA